MTNRRVILIVLAVTAIACLSVVVATVVVGWNAMQSPYRRALPATAREVQDYTSDEGGAIPQDYCYALKARLTEAEFAHYAETLGLALVPSEAAIMTLSGSLCGVTPPDWWDPPSTTSMYMRETKSEVVQALYASGYVHLFAYGR